MDIKNISEEKDSLKLLIKNIDIHLLNAIRRTVMNNVPTLAIENISIFENNSVLFDEFLGNRLGLIPLKTDAKSYKKGDKVKLVLQKEGPCMVYSSDIECKDPKIEVAFKDIPIVKLKEGQRIKMEMTACMNTGKEHAKWQPALISYMQLPKANSKKLGGELTKILAKNSYEWTQREMELLKKKGELDYSDKDFVLTIESYGGLENKEILMLAIDALKDKLKEFKEELKKIK